jgi:hypothetical protein
VSCEGPRGVCREERHLVLQVCIIKILTTTDEFWAFAAPAGVSLTFAIHATFSAEGVALSSPVASTAGAAYVVRRRAIVCHMAEFLALGTAKRFLLVLIDSVAVCINAYAFLKDMVSSGDALYL